MFRGVDLNSKEVCPSFSSFEFSNWDSSMEVWHFTYTDHDKNKPSVCIINIILTEKWSDMKQEKRNVAKHMLHKLKDE